jgi:hypothetical protein
MLYNVTLTSPEPKRQTNSIAAPSNQLNLSSLPPTRTYLPIS